MEEAATVCGVHRGTIRNWLKKDLAALDDSRPILILGSVLRTYLERMRAKDRRPLKPSEIYCVKCRKPKIPFGNIADLEVNGDRLCNLIGICEHCETVIYRRVSLRKWRQSIGNLEITLPKALEQLVNGNDPSLNCDLM